MATIIKAANPHAKAGSSIEHVAFNFNDMAAQADRYLDEIRAQAAKILHEAQRDAQTIRREAEQQGEQAARQAVEKTVEQRIAKQMQSAIPALQLAATQIQQARQAWLEHWRHSAVAVAVAIAGRVIRREVSQTPQITLDLVAEALHLAAGSADITIHLNPLDVAAIGGQVKLLADSLQQVAPATVVSDPQIGVGGCRVETRFGAIDQQFEAQLGRIAAELQ